MDKDSAVHNQFFFSWVESEVTRKEIVDRKEHVLITKALKIPNMRRGQQELKEENYLKPIGDYHWGAVPA